MPYDPDQGSLLDLGYLLAEAPKNVVFVVGAGLSRPAGLPDWSALLNILTKAAVEFIDSNHALQNDQKAASKAKLSALRDPWFLGDAIENILPRKLFEQIVTTTLSAKESQIPLTYRAIHALRPSGVISLNLDTLADLALDCLPDHIATAAEPSIYGRFLIATRPFLFKPHGTVTKPSSWVLGAQARNQLLKDSRHYRAFMSQLLAGRRLVFVGIAPDDLAVESLLLDDFRPPRSDHVPHFWIVPELTEARSEWAQLYNLRPIVYSPIDENHPEVYDILQRLAGFFPRERPAPLAYEGHILKEEDLPSDDSLRAEPTEDIRRKLNAALRGLCEGRLLNELQQSKEIASFYSRYGASTHMAWHVTEAQPHNRLFGHQIEERIGDGSFSTVWKATDVVDGTALAIKVLRQEILHQPGFVESFRRGVNAMKILRAEGVKGMVRFESAFDVPAAVVMEFVDGMTLDEALAAGAFSHDLARALRVLVDVATIVHRGHDLPQRVLHRDLKPSNIMIRDLWQNERSPEVVVLDFDLSWYDGALGRTLLGGGTLNFAAPEQLNPNSTYSTRHTAVDVFGLGALLYFVATGKEPQHNVQNRSDFLQTTEHATEDHWQPASVAVAPYLTGIIRNCMLDAQEERPAVAVFANQLREVIDVLRAEKLTAPSDLLLLELAARTERRLGPTWVTMPAEIGQARFKSRLGPAQGQLEFEDIGTEVRVKVVISATATGSEPRSNVAKYLRSRSERASSRLAVGGLFQATPEFSSGSAQVTAIDRVDSWTLGTCETAAEAISSAAAALALE